MLLKGIAALSCVIAVIFCYIGGWFASPSWLLALPLSFLVSVLALAALTFLVVWVSCLLVDQDKPQERDSKYYRTLMNLCIEAVVPFSGARIHTAGLEQIPREGRFLLLCNHLSMADPVVLLRCLPDRQLAFISKRENKDMFIVGKLMHKTLGQLINRENDREALRTILKCIELIREDKASVAVFPEGYTSLDGKLHHFRAGVLKIAQKTKVPIVVCTLRNTNDLLGNFKKLKPTDIHFRVAGVISPDAQQGHTTTDIAAMAYDMMLADLGEEFRMTEEKA